jgi:hypothetical protein
MADMAVRLPVFLRIGPVLVRSRTSTDRVLVDGQGIP